MATITTAQIEKIENVIYDMIMQYPDTDMADMGEARNAAKNTVIEWMTENGVTENMHASFAWLTNRQVQCLCDEISGVAAYTLHMAGKKGHVIDEYAYTIVHNWATSTGITIIY
jgi:hypothetical protein